MNAKTILAASLAALAIGVGGMGVAAAATQDNSGSSGMMQQGGSPGQSPSTMGDATSSGEGSGMMGGTETQGAMGSGMMGMHGGGRGDEGDSHAGMRERERAHGGMMGMMGGCPMAMGAGLDRKTAMKMHGEMMRAMGDILIKYADKIQEPAAKP